MPPIKWSPHIHPKVVGVLYKLPRPVSDKFRDIVSELQIDPYHAKATLRSGYTDVYEIPLNGYRLVYQIVDAQHLFRLLDLIP